MNVAEYIARFLHAQGVTHVFEVVGGMITQIVDALHRFEKVRLISVHHEQAAAMAAEATGKLTGIPGVAMATSGPGATNLLTGVGCCFFDSAPAVFITGQVNRNEQRGSRPIRQLGFQETDIVSMAQPITKAAWKVNDAAEVPELLRRAFELAISGRPGPVLLDIPMDVQRGPAPDEVPPRIAPKATGDISASALDDLKAALLESRRPLILAGGGVRASRTAALFRQFVELVQIPVVNSLLAVDLLPYDSPWRAGLIGSYGNRWSNLAVGRSDFLLVLGSRLDVRQTGADTASFKEGRTIFHVDCEAGEINNRVTGCYAIEASLELFFPAALRAFAGTAFPSREAWREEIAALKAQWPDTEEIRDASGINPNRLMHEISAVSRAAGVFVADVGQHQMWAAQSLELHRDQRFITSGSMGAMGYALPAAVGACFALAPQPVVMIAGDGGFQINIQELQTVVRHCLPLKMFVLNNRCYGMVRQFQQSYFAGRYPSTYWGYSAPDFARVAEAYGIASATVDDPKRVSDALAAAWRDPQAPYLLQVMIDPMTNAYPKMAFGRPITEMEPFAKPIEMEGT